MVNVRCFPSTIMIQRSKWQILFLKKHKINGNENGILQDIVFNLFFLSLLFIFWLIVNKPMFIETYLLKKLFLEKLLSAF